MVLRLTFVLSTLLSLACADTLYLRSGATIQGNFAGGDTRQLKMMVGDHVETYGIDEVARLEFGPAQAAEPHYREPPPNAEAAAAAIDIPAGTNIVIRMIDSVDSERDSLGHEFRASLDEPVVIDGQTLVPRNVDVIVKLVDDKESGKFTGKTALTLALRSIQINGRMVDVVTSEVTQASSSRSSRTAKTVGGGAVAGAVLGGIIGGGKGAAIGAASGGAVGAGAEVLTKGQRVKIPSETRLSFLLQQPVHI